MTSYTVSNWQDKVTFSAEGPQPQILLETEHTKVVLVALGAGQKIPPHKAPTAVYHIVDGSGWMTVNDERVSLKPGVLVTMKAETVRGVEAETNLVFFAVRA